MKVLGPAIFPPSHPLSLFLSIPYPTLPYCTRPYPIFRVCRYRFPKNVQHGHVQLSRAPCISSSQALHGCGGHLGKEDKEREEGEGRQVISLFLLNWYSCYSLIVLTIIIILLQRTYYSKGGVDLYPFYGHFKNINEYFVILPPLIVPALSPDSRFARFIC